MPKLVEICSHIRSKNAGPFWITVDLFFPDAETFARYSGSAALSASAIGGRLDVEPSKIKYFHVPALNVIKLSYPRETPQGGVTERDMHGGQQYVRLLDVEL